MYDEKKYYVVLRVYTKEERPVLKERSYVYGWTGNKNVLKAFLEQRDGKKYAVMKVPGDRLASSLKRFDDETGELMIDMLKLRSSQSGEEFQLFMTEREKDEVEKRIVRMFDDLCAIDTITGDINIDRYVDMIVNLESKYYDALFYLGYRPKEVEAKFDSVDDSMYENSVTYPGMPCEEFYLGELEDRSLRVSTTGDISNKIIYSIESFIKAMLDDL